MFMHSVLINKEMTKFIDGSIPIRKVNPKSAYYLEILLLGSEKGNKINISLII